MKTSKYFKNTGRLFLTLFDNFCVYRFNTSPSRSPLFVSWDINSKCNADCIYCNRNLFKQDDLKIDDKLAIIRQLGKAKTWMLSIAGGEPLLEENLDKIIYETKKQGMLLNISTNGILLKENAEMLVNSGVDFITISTDTHIEHLLDEIRRKNGVFSNILDGINEINKLKTKAPYLNMRIILHKQNLDNLDETISFWKQIADDVVLQPIHKSDSQHFTIPEHLDLTNLDKTAFKENFNSLLKKHRLFSKYNFEFTNFIFNQPVLKRKYKCFASYFFMDIDASGNLYSCGEHFAKLGNLLTDTYANILKSQETKEAGKMIKNRSCAKSCWYSCWVINTYLNYIL